MNDVEKQGFKISPVVRFNSKENQKTITNNKEMNNMNDNFWDVPKPTTNSFKPYFQSISRLCEMYGKDEMKNFLEMKEQNESTDNHIYHDWMTLLKMSDTLCEIMIDSTFENPLLQKELIRLRNTSLWLDIEKQVTEISNKPKFKDWIERNNRETQEYIEYLKSLGGSDDNE